MGECILARTASNVAADEDLYGALVKTNTTASGGMRVGFFGYSPSDIGNTVIGSGVTITFNNTLKLYQGNNNNILYGETTNKWNFNVHYADVVYFSTSTEVFAKARLYPNETKQFELIEGVILKMTLTFNTANQWLVAGEITNNASGSVSLPASLVNVVWVGEKV